MGKLAWVGVFLAAQLAVGEVSRLPPGYHTTTEIVGRFRDLADKSGPDYCEGLTVSKISSEPEILMAKLSRGKGRRRALFLFGEHARELISPETALRLVHDFCGLHKETAAATAALLEYYDIAFVPVANPMGRRMVEEGDFCRRTNEHDVDLNRNWPDHFERTPPGMVTQDTYSGPYAMSEPEVQALVKAVTAWPPHVFVTVHSGTLGMYSPYAYSDELPANVDAMLSVLSRANDVYCNCPMGAAGKQVGYLCPGTCLDFVYDRLRTPYAFAVEIFTSDFARVRSEWAMKKSAEGLDSAVLDPDVVSLLEADPPAAARSPLRQSLLRGGTPAAGNATLPGVFLEEEDSLTPEQCLSLFNPLEPSLYEEVTRKWSETFVVMLKEIRARGDLPLTLPRPGPRGGRRDTGRPLQP